MMYHNSVFHKEAVKALNINPEGVYVDVTFGGGGHSRLICEKLNSGKLIAQYKIKIYENDNEETLSERLLVKEHILYSKVLEEIISEKLIINTNEIFYKNSLLNKPMLFE